MGQLDRYKRKDRKVVVISLDGTPYSLMDRFVKEARMPNFAKILTAGAMHPMNSVYPPVSSVAWSSFMTGKNPGKHGIYGFVDRVPGSYKTYIATSKHMRSETLWEILSRHGKQVVVINVPVTYPPREVNGILIAGFLAPTLDKIAYPASANQTLKEMHYKIDIDPWEARKSKDKLLEDFHLTLARRAEAMFYFMDNEPWDFFMCHFMETDRLHHFLWEQMAGGDERYAPKFYKCYEEIDDVLGQVPERIGEDTTLIVMSDHGFCSLKKEVYINFWLAENGWLKFDKDPPDSIQDIAADSNAYSLDPGRIYINLKGREPAGSVEAGQEYEEVRGRLAEGLLEMRDPETGERMIEWVLGREEAYSGPCYEQAPDLILVPVKGYDLKGGIGKEKLTHKGALVGMHTYEDAMLYISGGGIIEDNAGNVDIVDVAPTILKLMDVDVPEDMEGKALGEGEEREWTTEEEAEVRRRLRGLGYLG